VGQSVAADAANLVRLRLYAVRAVTDLPEENVLRAHEPEQPEAQAHQSGGGHHPQYVPHPSADE